ncbi:MAG: hypothetical protein VX316_00225, partial [Actinomycetota bacterium]|nr:hypothetical protein [Actinomycetota bacterium]
MPVLPPSETNPAKLTSSTKRTVNEHYALALVHGLYRSSGVVGHDPEDRIIWPVSLGLLRRVLVEGFATGYWFFRPRGPPEHRPWRIRRGDANLDTARP